MERCPLCGHELVCRTSALRQWCLSPDCGAAFQDIHLDGAAHRLAGDEASYLNRAGSLSLPGTLVKESRS